MQFTIECIELLLFIAVLVALALGLPGQVPHCEQIITAAFGVVAFSIFVQGVTMTPLLRRLGGNTVREESRINIHKWIFRCL
ncbi:MAG TPA: hypothetical protein VMJ90_10730 [Anaerolineales bacterium]|nr:hypothetical protein [Anaerolineales bacterium]